MFKYKNLVFLVLIISFLFFSFLPTIFELSQSNKLIDKNREFILEHNYYWPDFNLYLSKIRQGFEGKWLAVEKYTSEPHQGSLIQIFYVFLGNTGKFLSLEPNFSYQLARIILSPFLFLIILRFSHFFFTSFPWQLIAVLIVIVSGSFPRIYTDQLGNLQIGRYMEWWSNIDALQRLTFIPHIMFGQVVSFFLLYQLTINRQQITKNKLILYIILGNLAGLVFPPSLITLMGVVGLTFILDYLKYVLMQKLKLKNKNHNEKIKILNFKLSFYYLHFAFLIGCLPSLFYLLLVTKTIPWSTLVEFHRTHPMLIPLDQYILGTGPVFFLGVFGALLAIINRQRKLYPLILWVTVTLGLAAFFSIIKEQSPLRFTQTGLFIPLGLLTAYLFYQLYYTSYLDHLGYLRHFIIVLYLVVNFFMMTTSLRWQTTFITQRVNANLPAVPHPPQTMYPLKEWMDGIRFLRDKTDHDGVVLAEFTAGNFIPAYAGNYVYWGQSNTVNYASKELAVDKFFRGKMSLTQAEIFFKEGRIKYIFFSVQEKEKAGGKELEFIYPFLKKIYQNPTVTILVRERHLL